MKKYWLTACAMALIAVSCTSEATPQAAPLDAFQGLVADFEAQQQAQWIEREAFVQGCMTEEGFEYVARPFIAVAEPPVWGIAPPVSEGEGYRLAAWISALGEQIESPAENPNRVVVSALAPGELAGWVEAFGGGGTTLDLATMVLLDESTRNPVMTDEAPNRGGCLGRALQDVGSSNMLEPLADELDMLLPRFGSDPDLLRAEQDWSLCMAESGHNYASPIALMEELQNDALAVEFTDVAIDEFADRELQIASADSACRDSTDYGATVEALDEEFAAEIVALLEQSPGS